MSSIVIPLPYRDPIAARPRAGGQTRQGVPPQPNKGRQFRQGVPAQPGAPQEDSASFLATQPWIKWFRFVDGKIEGFTELTSDPWSSDFAEEDWWSNAGGPGAGSWDVIDAEVNHPGIQRLTTSAANGDITSVWLPVAAAAGVMRWDQISTVTLNFRTGSNLATSRFECGISSDAAANWPATVFEFGSDMVYGIYDTAIDNNFHVRLRTGGVLRDDNTVITPCPASTWIALQFQRRQLTDGSFVLDLSFSRDDEPLTPINTVTTNLPADSMAFGGFFRVGTRVAATRDLDVDRFLMPPPTTTR